MSEAAREFRADEFDQGVTPVTDAEAEELRRFVERIPNRELQREIKALCGPEIDRWRLVLRVLVDDMRRVQAGRPPRYTPYDEAT